MKFDDVKIMVNACHVRMDVNVHATNTKSAKAD
jgi:hypothetical protein